VPSAILNSPTAGPRQRVEGWGGEPCSRARLVAGLIVLLMCAVVFFREVDSAPFVGDESSWMTVSYRHADALLRGDLHPRQWEFPDCGPYGNLNPQLGKLMMGVPLLLYTRHVLGEEPFDQHYAWEASLIENEISGNIPPRSQLRAARVLHAVYGLLAFAACYLFLWYCCGLLPAVCAGTLLVLNERFVLTMSRAMMDAPFHLFTVLGLLCIAGYLQAGSSRRAWAAAGLTGICAGLAASVKVTGILLIGLFLLPFLILKHPFRGAWKPVLGHGIAYAVAALFVVYLLNPFFWPEFRPEERSQSLAAELRQAWQSRPVLTFPDEPDMTLGANLTDYTFERDRVREVYPRLYGLLRPAEFPLLFARWNSWLEEQQTLFPIPPPTAAGFHRRLFLEFAAMPGNVVFALAGLFVCIQRSLLARQRGLPGLFAVPLVFALVSYAFWLATMRLELDRYYVAPLIGVQMLAGIGLAVVLQQVADWSAGLSRRTGPRPPEPPA